MNIIQQRIAGLFNEWARRYAENPNEFGAILDAAGRPVEDYGQRCAIYFEEIAKDMDSKGLLPIQGEAAEPPLDCRVGRTEWFSVQQDPPTVGWYEYDGWMIDEGTKMYWNGNQWGYWINEQPRRNWTQMAEVATDKWRGILAHNGEVKADAL